MQRKGIHRVAAGTKRARQMNSPGRQANPLFVDPEVKAWNDAIEAKRGAAKGKAK